MYNGFTETEQAVQDRWESMQRRAEAAAETQPAAVDRNETIEEG